MGHLFDHRIFGSSVVRIAASGKLAVWSPAACIERAGMRIGRAGESLADRRRADRRAIVGFPNAIGPTFTVPTDTRLEPEKTRTHARSERARKNAYIPVAARSFHQKIQTR